MRRLVRVDIQRKFTIFLEAKWNFLKLKRQIFHLQERESPESFCKSKIYYMTLIQVCKRTIFPYKKEKGKVIFQRNFLSERLRKNKVVCSIFIAERVLLKLTLLVDYFLINYFSLLTIIYNKGTTDSAWISYAYRICPNPIDSMNYFMQKYKMLFNK